jgi:hypothetical protein
MLTAILQFVKVIQFRESVTFLLDACAAVPAFASSSDRREEAAPRVLAQTSCRLLAGEILANAAGGTGLL